MKIKREECNQFRELILIHYDGIHEYFVEKILDKEINAGLKISLLLKLSYPAISF